MHASNAARFEQSYREIAITAKLSGAEDPKIDILGLVSRWLGSDDSRDWLMILDNADDTSIFFNPSTAQVPREGGEISSLSRYLSSNAKSLILITSRDKNTAIRLAGNDDRVFRISAMGEEDTNTLLAKKLPNDQSNQRDKSELIKVLEYIPLAITQASAYIAIKAPRMTISGYLELFRHNESNLISLLSKDGGDLRRDPDVPNSVVATWQISFDQIKDQNTAAADLLSCMCLLDRQGIPGFLFYQSNSGSSIDFEDSIGTLIEFSLIVEEKEKNSFEMHRLVQLATRKWLEMHEQMEKQKEEVLNLLADQFPNGEHSNWKICEALGPHAEIILKYKYLSQHCRLQQAGILHNSAWYALAQGKYAIAEIRIQEAIKIKKELLEMEIRNTLNSLGLLASTFWNQGRWKEAEELEVQVMRTSTRVLGEEHPSTLTSMANLASTFWNQGRWKEAEELEVQVMRTSTRVLGEEHPSTLISMANLAHTYKLEGRHDEAIELMESVVNLRTQKIGASHPHTLGVVNTLKSWLHS